MSNIDEQFVMYVVKSLVGNPDAVQIARSVDDRGVLLELTVDPDDLGRVIGKRGATAQSLRTLLRALGTKNDARYNLKIVDNGPPRSNDDKEHPRPSEEKATSAEPATPAPTPEEAEEPAEELADDDTNDVVSKTRKELEEFDDLDL